MTIEKAKEFVEYVLPQLIFKKNNGKDKEYTWHKATRIIPNGLKRFKGGADLAYCLYWLQLCELFEEKDLRPTHCREFVVEGNLHLELYSKGRRRDTK